MTGIASGVAGARAFSFYLGIQGFVQLRIGCDQGEKISAKFVFQFVDKILQILHLDFIVSLKKVLKGYKNMWENTDFDRGFH